RGVVVVVIAPLAQPHLLADQVHAFGGAFGQRDAVAEIVNRDGCLMGMGDGPNDVLWSPGGVPAEINARSSGLERDLVHYRHVPLAELDADVAPDPGERRLLADGQDDVVARAKDSINRRGTPRLGVPLDPFALHAA